MLSSFLAEGLIEARSNERMMLLAEKSSEKDLKDLYDSQLLSKTALFDFYWFLYEKCSAIVTGLEELSKSEAQALNETLEKLEDVRMHSVDIKSYWDDPGIAL